MRRREFILGLGGAAACAVAAPAQQPTQAPSPSSHPVDGGKGAEEVRRVGVLILGTEADPVDQTRVAALRDGLKTLDWIEGHNLRLDFRFGGADANRIRGHAKELVSLAPDVIVTGATSATSAVEELTRTIPIVFVEGNNGTAFGLRDKLTRPEGNTTGIINLYLGIGARWVELLKQAAPRTRRIAVLFNPEFNSSGYLAAIEATAATSDVKAIKTPVRNAEDIRRAIGALASEPNAALLLVPPAPAYTDVELIFRLATQYRLPAIYPNPGFAEKGGLMAFGADSADMFRNAASYVDRILHGAKPSDLTIQFPTKFELVLNLKVARSIGLNIPKSLIVRAAQVIDDGAPPK